MEEKFIFVKERSTKRKVVFERDNVNCPIDSFYIDKKSALSDEQKLEVTIKPAT